MATLRTLLKQLSPDLTRASQTMISNKALKPAAILVPFIERPIPTLLLTQRSSHLKVHRGQICFPGGQVAASDSSMQATALRETYEETGINSKQIEIIRTLKSTPTYSGYQVTPVIGLVKPPFEVQPCQHEVSEIFEIPIAYFKQDSIFKTHVLQDGQQAIGIDYFYYKHRYIWGFTARLIKQLFVALKV